MKNKEERKTGRYKGGLFAILCAALMVVMVVAPIANASAAQQITNDEPSTDMSFDDSHNSYAWCGALFEQTDSDYLWVGTNRDLDAAVVAQGTGLAPWSSEFQRMYDMLGMEQPSKDNAGKIYRYNMNDPEGGWEFVFDDPMINGWRKMVVFNGDLYVFAGLTNMYTYDQNGDPQYLTNRYSAIYKFSADYQSGDQPEVVFWERLTSGAEYFRAAHINDGILYVGTFDCRIFATDGSGLASLTPLSGEKDTGWELVVDIRADPLFAEIRASPYWGNSCVWDLTWLGDSLYAFVNAADGFRVFKLTPAFGEWEMSIVVGANDNALYPQGVGIGKHPAASPFLFTVDDEEYVYVSTFANGPSFLGAMAGEVTRPGSMLAAFDNFYNAAVMYRFNADDVWEVVVGDSSGFVAVDKAGVPLNHIGDTRAGFYPGAADLNPSSNLYIWWMAEHDGKMWASTWDVGMFRDYAPVMIGALWIQNGDAGLDVLMDLLAKLLAIYNNIMAVAEALGEIDYQALADELGVIFTAYAEEISAAVDAGATTEELIAIIQQLPEDRTAVRTTAAGSLAVSRQVLYDSVVDLINAIRANPGVIQQAVDTLSMAYSNALFFAFLTDTSDPAGFDLFFSEDGGVTWTPYTVNGFDNAFNYGGRVILPAGDYGLFILTANPFAGCEVWKIGDDGPSVISYAPDNVIMTVGDTETFYVKTIGTELTAADFGDGSLLSADIALVKQLDPIRVYTSTVTTEGGRYIESGAMTMVPVYLYEVTLTALDACGPTVMEYTLTSDALTVDGTMDVQISGIWIPPYLEIVTLPGKLVYFVGESLDLTGLTVRLVYEDGTADEMISYVADPAHGTILDTVGTVTIDLSYQLTRATSATPTSFEVTVEDIIEDV
ncbi:MAG: bacterial Ig-like domain-containing protein, partial [Methanomassiliicoccaceae archaeon]|nr:bacterial Ig-like domain-containing protein [Methanomassiliicoccaceae archaeon]